MKKHKQNFDNKRAFLYEQIHYPFYTGNYEDEVFNYIHGCLTIKISTGIRYEIWKELWLLT